MNRNDKKFIKIFLLLLLLTMLLVFMSCSGEVVSQLPKEYHGGVIRGKTEQLVTRNLSLQREYYLSIMTKDSTLYALRVPLIFYNTYNKGDTIK